MELTSSFDSVNPNQLFANSNVSKKDLVRYTKLIEEGNDQQAIDEFIAKYVKPYVSAYQDTMQEYLRQAEQGQLSQTDSNKLEESIILLALALSTMLTRNFKDFTDILAPSIFKENGIVSGEIKDIILKQTLAQFEQLTKNAMLETQANVLTYVRTMQKEMIVQNQLISKTGLVDDLLKAEIQAFKNGLKIKYPDYYKAMENGQILKSRLLADGSTINYKLDYYSEMSIRTTLLNVDRTAVEITANIDGEKVVEYYLRDNRTVKEPRQICIDILGNRIHGKSLLALDQETANKLGVMTLDTAKGQYAMGVHCRHSIRPVSKEFLKTVGL